MTARGNNRNPIVVDDADRMTLLRRLRAVAERTSLVVHAYCVMDNHLHAVVQPSSATLGTSMRLLLGGYAHGFNKRHGRTGHVFEGPYDERPVRGERYLIAACVYVVLNPVRAGVCVHPSEWRWSSYRTTAGLEPRPVVAVSDVVLGSFGARKGAARRAFAALVEREAANGRRMPSTGRTAGSG